MNTSNRTLLVIVLVVGIALGAVAGLVAARQVNAPEGVQTPTEAQVVPTLPPTAAIPPTETAPPPTATEVVAATATEAAAQEITPAPKFLQAAVQNDVTYCTADGVPLGMDIYPPLSGANSPSPVLLFVHGGGWTGGDKSEATMWASLLTGENYTVASINYRLAPRYKWPAQIEDVKCAVRYLRANAQKLNIDPARIGAMGDSAGGHLVSLLGLTGNDAGSNGTGGYPEQSSSVKAIVDLYGPTDFTSAGMRASSLQISELLGVTVRQAEPVLAAASPITYVHAGAPPFLIIQGDMDRLVPPAQSQSFYDKLKAAGNDATLIMVKNAGHGFTPAGGQICPTLPQIARSIGEFLAAQLK